MRVALLTTDNRELHDDCENPVPHFGTAPEALIQGFTKFPKLEVHVVSCARRQLNAPAKIHENIWFHSLYVPKTGWLRTGYQGCIRAVRKRLQRIRPDIVHGQGTEKDCAISAVFSGLPNVVTIHGNMRLITKATKSLPLSYNWFMAKLEKITLPRTDGVICITRYTRAAVEDLTRKTWLIPNAVDESFFQIHRKEASHPEILCVGNICPRKNQNAFIRALDDLADRNAFQLIFLGSSDSTDSYSQEFLNLIGKRSWCRYDGVADRQKLKAYFSQAALLALPSLEDNCPMVVLEAMAAGLPVAAANVGGVPDLVEQGKTGALFDPLIPSSMRDCIANLLENAEPSRQMAVQALGLARERFHPRMVANQHLAVYREVLQTRL